MARCVNRGKFDYTNRVWRIPETVVQTLKSECLVEIGSFLVDNNQVDAAVQTVESDLRLHNVAENLCTASQVRMFLKDIVDKRVVPEGVSEDLRPPCRNDRKVSPTEWIPSLGGGCTSLYGGKVAALIWISFPAEALRFSIAKSSRTPLKM